MRRIFRAHGNETVSKQSTFRMVTMALMAENGLDEKKHPPNDESNATQCLKQATLMNNISKMNNTSTADSSDIIPSEYTLSVCRLGILILPPFPSLAPGWHLQWVVFV